MAPAHDVFNLESTRVGTHVVHGDEFIYFSADVAFVEFTMAELVERLLEPVFQVCDVLVNVLRAVDPKEAYAVDRL